LASVGNITFLGCTVVSTMTRDRSDGFHRPVFVATEKLSWISAKSFSSPCDGATRQRRAVERQVVPEEFLAAQIW